MPTPTYELIASATTTGTDIEFAGLGSSGARDFVLVIDTSVSGGTTPVRFQLNNDTGSNYHGVYMQGNGSAQSGGSFGVDNWIYPHSNNLYVDGRANMIVQFIDASSTTKHKPVLIRTNIPNGSYAGVTANMWRYSSTSAITTIDIDVAAGATVRAYLFGVIS